MAEYFPLIDRAIASLTDGTAEARRAIYERARGALIGQLRKTEPAVPEEDIMRESVALDEAIARVEAKFADPGAVGATPIEEAPPRSARPPPAPAAATTRFSAAGRDANQSPRTATPAPPAATPAEPAPASAGPRRTGAAPPLPTGKVPPVASPPTRERPVIGPAPTVAGEVRPGIAPARPLVANRAARPTLPLRPGAMGPSADAATAALARGPAPLARAAGESMPPDPSSAALPPVADLSVGRLEATSDGGETARDEEAGEAVRLGEKGSALPPLSSARIREGAVRPAAPRPSSPRRFGWPAALLAGLVALVMVGVGIAAWRLRDKPEQLAAAHPGVQAPETPEAGKIGDRAAPAQEAPTDGTPAGSGSGVAVPAPVGQNDGGQGGPTLPVAQRAALLLDAPDEPQKIKTYSGTVVWHLDSVSPGQGLPLALAIRADVDIPDAKLKVTMVMQRNLEPQLPASHTIELHFLPQPGYALGNVIQINMPDLRKDDSPSGDALVGVPVTIDANTFLVGLSRGGAEAQNRRLITERNWFDVGVLLAPQRPAKLTFEKGIDGQRLWDQAFAAWGDAKGASGGTQ